MTENEKKATPVQEEQKTELSRRSLFGATAAVAGAGVLASQLTDPIARTAYAAGSDAPIRIGFQVHRTGIGATYGKWYERTTNAAAKYINDLGGMGGRPVEIVAEDDGTDPKRGADVVEKFATQHKVDFVYGTLFSHVVMGPSPHGRKEFHRQSRLCAGWRIFQPRLHHALGRCRRLLRRFPPDVLPCPPSH